MKINYTFEMGEDRDIDTFNRITKEKVYTSHRYLPEDRVRAASWEVIPEDEIEKNFKPLEGRTNDFGEGLFSAEMEQYEGTWQFSVYGLTKDAARRRIRKYYLEQY